jgi:cyclic dehypoxanthinyl futalosine synthase
VLHISKLNHIPLPQVIERLVAAGMDSIPGGGAEILVDRVRKLLNCYGKATSDEWLDVMRQAHRAGLRTTATMMYGTVETDEERIEHMMRSAEAAGRNRRLHRVHHVELSARAHGTRRHGGDAASITAHARAVAHRPRQLRQPAGVVGDAGGKVGQLSLAYGANDMGSVMIEENVVRAAGASYCMDELEIVVNIEDAGFIPSGRNMHYEISGRSDLPRARRAADAVAGDGARGRRRVRARGSCATIRPGAAKASASASLQ